MNTPVTNPIEMGQSIADVGFVIMAAASYLIFSAVIIFFFVKWFVRIVNGVIERQQQILNESLQLLKELHAMVKTLKDELTPTPQFNN